MKYSVEFKQAAVQKYLSRGNRSVNEILSQLQISSANLYQWRDVFAMLPGMKKPSTPHSRSVQEKLKSLIEYDALELSLRGEYLRSHGLHEENLIQWRS